MTDSAAVDWLGVGPLSSGRITLRPFTVDDVAALATVIDNPERFRWTAGTPTDEASARAWIDAAQANSTRIAFAVVDNLEERVVGSTSYYDVDPANLTVAIGYTFYGESAQGTAINPTAKYLLMQHAFEDCGAVRIVWHTHESNAQSRAAIAKLGATFEGLLRKHRRFGDGWRTTAQYAMTDEDWPAIKVQLAERIAAFD